MSSTSKKPLNEILADVAIRFLSYIIGFALVGGVVYLVTGKVSQDAIVIGLAVAIGLTGADFYNLRRKNR